LTIREELLGPDHPDTATGLNSLASLHHAQGRYDDAEPLYTRALTIREEILGPDHPDTVISLNNLAKLYQAQGRYDDAEPLLTRVLTIFEVLPRF
jgi:tetratricopeptide (TPR) repeat protein